MLLELTVENLGAIERAEIALGEGSSALTGETGAGKTLVVAALGLLLGGRADRILVRSGAEEARVEGRFVLPGADPAVRRLVSEGVLEEGTGTDAEVVIARAVPASGRASTARINGRLVTASLLSDIGPHLADIAGQHEEGRIGKARWQRETLDSYAGERAQTLASEVRAAVTESARIERELADLRAGERQRSRELDVLRYEIAEIEAASPRPGESSDVSSELARIENAEALAEGLTESAAALGGEGGAQELVNDARSRLARLSEVDPALKDLEKRLSSIDIELADIAADVSGRVAAPDPEGVSAMRERLEILNRLRRKYGDDESQVLGYLEKAREREEQLARAEHDLPALEKGLKEARERARGSALELSDIRTAAAARLADEIERLLAGLAMETARLDVSLEPVELYEGGLERVELRVAANPGEEPRPLSKVASGGELSRIALALYLVATTRIARTTVFDEVDAGVGGAAAQSVGRALAKLARSGGQVIVVTHLPQVAAFADTHLSVDKLEVSGRSSASVRRVEGDDRIAELSRMLAGLPDSERGRGHAKELLEIAASTGVAP
jgi:DNA repair protein RecN (Recombination protein N)